jgi:hypothetical protein
MWIAVTNRPDAIGPGLVEYPHGDTIAIKVRWRQSVVALGMRQPSNIRAWKYNRASAIWGV